MTDKNNNNNLTLKQRLEQNGGADWKGPKAGRKEVKEEIVHAYELHKAAETLELVLKEDDRLASNPMLNNDLQQLVETKKKRAHEILDIPSSLLTVVEMNYWKLTKYQIQNDEKDIVKVRGDDSLSKWIGHKRCNIFGMQEGIRYTNKDSEKTESAVAALKDDMKWLKRLNVNLDRIGKSVAEQKTFEDRIQELIEYKEKHGHLKVPQIHDENGSHLGAWVKRTRKEYDYIQDGRLLYEGKNPSLTPQKIARLDELGFIWRIRQARPKKGDPRFRLRRKSDQQEQQEEVAETNQPAGCNEVAQDSASSNDEPPKSAEKQFFTV